MSYLSEYEEINDGYVSFRGDPKGGKITSKGKISTGGLTCLFAKATLDESNLWHRRLRHINFKTMNKLNQDSKGDLTDFVLENKPNVVGSGPTWLFDIDTLTKSMNYKPIEKKDAEDPRNEDNEVLSIEEARVNQEKDANVNSTNNINIVGPTANDAGIKDNDVDENIVYGCADDPNMPNLEEIVYSDDDEDVGVEADMTNLDTNIPVSLILTTRIHKDHPVEQIIGDIHSATQTKRMTKSVTDHVVRIEEIRLFLAYASFKDFVVYQMDVKSGFLYGKIEEEVYVYQPLRFEDPEFHDRVYKVEKSLYGLHQAPRAWYETLSTYLLDNGFQRGQIDKNLFIKMVKGDILLVQVYVDDIIFGSIRKEMCTEFKKIMHKKFQMSLMVELTFFLRLQVTQKDDGIFISQDKYVNEILKKFSFSTVKTASTPMETSKPLLKDENAKDVDVYLYRSMIRSLTYLTSLMPDIMSVVCACVRFQVTPKVLHLHAVKRIFRYLKGQPKLGLWYPKDSPFNLEAYTDSDYAGASLDKKSTNRSEIAAKDGIEAYIYYCQLKVNAVRHKLTTPVDVNVIEDVHNLVAFLSKPIEYEGFEQIIDFLNGNPIKYALTIHAKVDGKNVIISEATIRRDLKFEDEGGVDCLSNEVIFEQLPLMGRQKTMGDAAAQTRSERVSKFSNYPPLLRVNTLGSREDRLQLKELMLYKVGLGARVDSFAEEESLGEEESSKQGRIEDIDADDNITLVNDQEMFDADRDLQGEEVVARQEKEVLLKETQYVPNIVKMVIEDNTTADIEEIVSIAALITTVVTDDELTMAQALVEIKKLKPKGATTTTTTVTIPTPNSTRPKARGVVMQDPSETPTTTILKFQKFKTKEKEEEQGELTIKEKSRFFVELMDKRKKHFAKLRSEEKRRKPPTKAQKRNQICSSKRAGEKLEQESVKKQRIEEENESTELKRCLEIVSDDGDDVTIDAIPLSTKSSIIVDYKIYKEGRKSYF
uniref:Putative ribonuclease H-like domain-containing protein n=1 Tax=Tanacetum cinerariifolium TaxID=118510 RepID=A0A6L2JKX3_TANCI|nr:putative ribonuclease H-like domain-containing protein [Tanacetum cinerariifolium]